MKKHEYLRELFPDKLPFPYGEKGYPDFDERDTFDLCDTFIMWMYEHLRYFQDVASKKVVMDDPELEVFEVDGEKLTRLQCIDRMVESCKIILLEEEVYPRDLDKMEAAKDDLFKVLTKVFWQLGW